MDALPGKMRTLRLACLCLGVSASACLLAPGAVTAAPSGARVGTVGRAARVLPEGLGVRHLGHGGRIGGRFFGFDDDLQGAGFGLAGGLVGAGLQGPGDAPYGAGPFPAGVPPFRPNLAGMPPCVRPQIIKIGGGPRRTGVRVVYGASPPCGP